MFNFRILSQPLYVGFWSQESSVFNLLLLLWRFIDRAILIRFRTKPLTTSICLWLIILCCLFRTCNRQLLFLHYFRYCTIPSLSSLCFWLLLLWYIFWYLGHCSFEEVCSLFKRLNFIFFLASCAAVAPKMLWCSHLTLLITLIQSELTTQWHL